MDVEIEKQFFRKVVTFNYSIVHNVYDSTSHSTPPFSPLMSLPSSKPNNINIH